MAQGTQYEVTVTSPDRKTPLLRYRGPVDRVSGLSVQRFEDDEVQLIYKADDGAAPGVILGIAKDPGGDLTLERVELDDELKPRGKPVSKAV